MKEFKSILDAVKGIDFSKQKAALATVVKVSGSSYRSPGARMLITDNGKWVGSISGGCLEGDALRKARQVMSSKEAMTVRYDTREESNQNLGIGLGCNGVIDVLIEPLDASENSRTIDLFHHILATNQPVALATVHNGPANIGEKLLIDQRGQQVSSFSNENLRETVETELIRIFDEKKTESKSFHVSNADYEVFLELVVPNIKLMIFGGGFDARPVSQLAKALGWEVNVTDECVAHIAPIFFPDADKLSLCHREYIDREFDITPFTACVLMSHNYEYDRDVLRKIIESPTPYIGILGPRKRFDKMLTEYASSGLVLTPEQLSRVHSPIGLDIGAETPDEIALSIIGEIKGKFAHRSGGYLKYRQGPIHDRNPRDGQIFKQFFINNDLTQAANE